jgi:uncharacterized protein (TIGR03086 family)
MLPREPVNATATLRAVPSVASELARTHLRVCGRFAQAVDAAQGRWERPSPCAGWNARDVLEHVIGFHDVLLLRPLDAKPHRPRDDPERRWSVTFEALQVLLSRPGLFDAVIDVPAVGQAAAAQLDARRLVPTLSQDVLVHAWDLARAVGADERLDPELCARFSAASPIHPNALVMTGMFGPPVTVPTEADPQSHLLARLGRDPT